MLCSGSMKALFRHFSGSIQALFRLCSGSIQALSRLSSGLIQALSRVYQGSIRALSRVYQGSIKALLRLHWGFITALWRLSEGSIKALLRLYCRRSQQSARTEALQTSKPLNKKILQKKKVPVVDMTGRTVIVTGVIFFYFVIFSPPFVTGAHVFSFEDSSKTLE